MKKIGRNGFSFIQVVQEAKVKSCKMKVLQFNQTIFKLLGIIDSKQEPNHTQMIISKYICLISPILFLVALIGFFLMNFTNVAQATSACYLICVTGNGFLTYLDFLLNRTTVVSIIQRFQNMANSCDPKFQPFYVKCENQINKIAYHFKTLIFTSIYSVFSVPIVVSINQWLNGNFSMDLLVLPASLLYINIQKLNKIQNFSYWICIPNTE